MAIVEDADSFTGVGESLKRHWTLHRVEINAGVSEEELNAFEVKHRVVLPHDMRSYFSCVNGMPLDVVDEALIRFWTLNEMKPLTEGAPAYSDPRYIQRPKSIFLFADYSIWAHAYAIRLESIPLQANEVCIIGGDRPSTIAHSFSELVDRYLTNKELLH